VITRRNSDPSMSSRMEDFMTESFAPNLSASNVPISGMGASLLPLTLSCSRGRHRIIIRNTKGDISVLAAISMGNASFRPSDRPQ
jgi:hypothetical protein